MLHGQDMMRLVYFKVQRLCGVAQIQIQTFRDETLSFSCRELCFEAQDRLEELNASDVDVETKVLRRGRR